MDVDEIEVTPRARTNGGHHAPQVEAAGADCTGRRPWPPSDGRYARPTGVE